jgi:helix-turn-helix protein
MKTSGTMTKETLHKVLAEYVSKQIAAKADDLTAEEWIMIMNCYSSHFSASFCAKKVGITVKEIEQIYYQFSMEASLYAMEHPF